MTDSAATSERILRYDLGRTTDALEALADERGGDEEHALKEACRILKALDAGQSVEILDGGYPDFEAMTYTGKRGTVERTFPVPEPTDTLRAQTILLALRYFQRHRDDAVETMGDEVLDVCAVLTTKEIDELCEEINTRQFDTIDLTDTSDDI